MNSIQNEFNKIQQYIENTDYASATSVFHGLIDTLKSNNDTRLPEVFYEFGMYLFDLGDYASCVPFLIAAYNSGYEKQSILDFLYDCFITPNLEEFKQAYEIQLQESTSMLQYESFPSYEELPIDFIPVSDYCFYLFDKTTQGFCGNIDYSDNSLSEAEEINLPDNYYDLTISDEWNLTRIQPYIKATENRKLYMITSDALKTLSFFKLLSITKRYMRNLLLFDTFDKYKKYLHSNPSLPLPRLHYGSNSEITGTIKEFFNQEHAYRLTPEGRRTDNVLLSICIPTFDRGHRALQNVLSLLDLPLDAEIEIVVSNNGSVLYKEEYNEIQKLTDARITYFAFETNQGFSANVAQVIHLSKAPFALILSDEDSLVSYNLTYYLSILKKNPSLALVRGSSCKQYVDMEDICAKAGMPAFRASFLAGNYISGFIYNTKLIKKIDIPNLQRRYDDNPSYNALGSYPHMWWHSLLVFLGDFQSDSHLIIKEGASELEQQYILQGTYDQCINENLCGLQRYSMIESRVIQHHGFVTLVNILPFKNLIERFEGYCNLCLKTYSMFAMVKNIYLCSGFTLDYMSDMLIKCLIEGIDLLEPKLDKKTYKDMKEICYAINEDFKIY